MSQRRVFKLNQNPSDSSFLMRLIKTSRFYGWLVLILFSSLFLIGNLFLNPKYVKSADITISGTAYTAADKSTNLGAGKTIGLSVNGAAKTTVETIAGGTFSFNPVAMNANNTITLFIDDEAEEGTLISQALNGNDNITSLEMFTNTVVLRHESAGPLNDTLLATADTIGDDDIHYNIANSTTTFDAGFEVKVDSGKTYTSTNDLVITNLNLVGNLTTAYSISLSGGNLTGDGIITQTGGEFLLDGTGDFGGANNWTFNNLTFGDGTGAATTTKIGDNNITVTGKMTVAANQTLLAGDDTWNIDSNGAGFLSDLKSISSGAQTCGVKTDGSKVYCWGNYVDSGNTNPVHYSPTPVRGVGGTGYLSDISLISSGRRHVCALKRDGSRVYCWGTNANGQLGDNTTNVSEYPTEVLGPGGVGFLSSVVSISAGENSTCAAKSDGSAYCWGANTNNMLGDGTGVEQHTPSQVKGVGGVGTLANISQVSAGNIHGCALKSDGTRVYCWGNNNWLQKGSDVAGNNVVEVKGVGGAGVLTDISSISTRFNHGCALKTDQTTVYCWGTGSSGRLGNGASPFSSLPVIVKGVGGVGNLSSISSIVTSYQNSCALKADGTRVYCWGKNRYGAVGDNSTVDKNTPVEVLATNGVDKLSSISTIAGGPEYACAIKSDKSRVYCWGDNDSLGGSVAYTLGNGTVKDSLIPVEVVGPGLSLTNLRDLQTIESSETMSCGIRTNGGKVYCWGNSSASDGGFPTAVEVKGVGGVGHLSDISSLAVGVGHACAVKSDGSKVYCWGWNDHGNLGDDTTNSSENPVEVKGVGGVGTLTNISQVTAGYDYTCALKSDYSKVYCWGDNSWYNLGVGLATLETHTPMEVPGIGGVGTLSDIKSVQAGDYSACALKSDGSRVYCWGYTPVGDGTWNDRDTPVEVVDTGGVNPLTDIGQITGGSYFFCGVRTDMTHTYCWGLDNSGQLGDGPINVGSNKPVETLGPDGVNPFTNVTSIDAYRGSVCAVTSNSNAYCWGDGLVGQLGKGDMISADIPTAVKGVGGVGNLTSVSKVAVGYSISGALKNDGTEVYTWGTPWGSLGDGLANDSLVPVIVKTFGANVLEVNGILTAQASNFILSSTSDAISNALHYNIIDTTSLNNLTINQSNKTYVLNHDITLSGNVSISGGTIQSFGNDITLTGDWTNNDDFIASGNTVIFNGTTHQNVTAGGTGIDKKFFNLTSENTSATTLEFIDDAEITGTLTNITPDSKMVFNDGSTYNVANINIQGSACHNITLSCSNPGVNWLFNVAAAAPTASYVTVQDSNALGGSQIDASTGGVSTANNFNWLFGASDGCVAPPPVGPGSGSHGTKKGSDDTITLDDMITNPVDTLVDFINNHYYYSPDEEISDSNQVGIEISPSPDAGLGGSKLEIDLKNYKQSPKNLIFWILVIMFLIYTIFKNIPSLINILTSLSDIGPLVRLTISHFWQSISLRQKKKPWGIVYDSKTGRPIPLVALGIYQRKDNKLMQRAVSDRRGRYAFLTKLGQFYLRATKKGYTFPSKDHSSHLYEDEYFDKIIEIKSKDQPVAYNVPLDRFGFDLKASFWGSIIKLGKFLFRLRIPVLIVGTIYSLYLLITDYQLLYLLSVVLYFCCWFLEYLFWIKPKAFGRVVYNNSPLNLVIVRIYNSYNNKLIGTDITDVYGRFLFIVPTGTYHFKALKKSYHPYQSNDLPLTGIKTMVSIEIILEK